MPGERKYPRLRPVESIVVPDSRHGKVLVLRDTQGIADGHATIPPGLVPIVARFTGEHSYETIAREASRELQSEVTVDLVERLADELDEALFLESKNFRRARAEIERVFADASVRPASHAGGAYEGDPKALRRYLNDRCLAKAKPEVNGHGKHIVGLVAPHIDPWRGAVGYGHAYGALAARLSPEADTFVLFGTSHAPMRQPFALCRKSFDTPLGAVEADVKAIDSIAGAARFDPYADQFNHKREHSLEFQVVFLKHLLGERKARIIPILAGLGEHQASGEDPTGHAAIEAFLDAVREVVESRPGRVVVIAGADMAHVGPRFGDETPMGAEERGELQARDHNSLGHAIARDASAFWEDVAGDLDTRRVCGLGPIYSLLRSLPAARPAAKAKNGAGEAHGAQLLHYEQTIDKDDGSIVSHAGLAFFG
jgi:AmmeMemoRadiSam system protein B